MFLISGIPAVVLLLVALVLSVGLACFGQLLVHRRFRRQSFIEHNEVGGVIFVQPLCSLAAKCRNPAQA